MSQRAGRFAALSVLALLAGCSADDQPASRPEATVTVTETVTASPATSETAIAQPPEPAASETSAPESDGCAKPTQTAAAKWETEDVAFPRRNLVKTRWSDAEVEATFTNNSEHTAVLDFVMFFVAKPRGTQPKPRFPMFSIDSDTQSVEVEPGDTFTAPQQPFGLRDWMEYFPLYTKQEPRVSVSFDWHYKDDNAQAECVDEPNRTVPVGMKPRVLSREPWVASARFAKAGLAVTVRNCAGDTKEVFDGSEFYAEHPDGTKVQPSTASGAIKVPVAANQCRSLNITFNGVTSRDWAIVHPASDEATPLRWTLKSI